MSVGKLLTRRVGLLGIAMLAATAASASHTYIYHASACAEGENGVSVDGGAYNPHENNQGLMCPITSEVGLIEVPDITSVKIHAFSNGLQSTGRVCYTEWEDVFDVTCGTNATWSNPTDTTVTLALPTGTYTTGHIAVVFATLAADISSTGLEARLKSYVVYD